MAKDCEAAKIIEEQLIEVYGLLLTRKQLAEVLQRRIGGLNWELGRHDSALRRALGPATLKIGRRSYYRAADLALILSLESV